MFGSVRVKFVLAFCVLLTVNVRAQSMRQIHEKIDSAEALSIRINQAGWSGDGVSYLDSLVAVDNELTEYLFLNLPKIPNSLSSNFEEIPGVWVTSSPDHKMRAWSWDTQEGGTRPVMECLIEYQTSRGIQVVIGYDTAGEASYGGNNSLIDTIYTIRSRGGKTYYLPRRLSQGSSILFAQEIDAYTIEDIALNMAVPLFQTAKKLLRSIEIGYYDMYSGDKHHFIELLADGKTLSIPVVRETKKYPDGGVTSKTIRYVFDGEHFVYKGIGK
jgi:hypothetical protein